MKIKDLKTRLDKFKELYDLREQIRSNCDSKELRKLSNRITQYTIIIKRDHNIDCYEYWELVREDRPLVKYGKGYGILTK